MGVLDRRLLGPIKSQMGGDPDPSSGGGGGVTITNNVEANKVEGIPQLRWNSSDVALSASADIYVSGSNNYLYLHGSDADGKTVRYRFRVSGSILQVAPDSPEGSI